MQHLVTHISYFSHGSNLRAQRPRLWTLLCWGIAVTLLGSGGFWSKPAAAAPTTPVLRYGSYLGGNSSDEARGVALDSVGNIYVIGKTFSDDPLGVEHDITGYSDIFVAKFNPAGDQLLYLKVIGGKDSESPVAIAVDAQGNAYATVLTFDATFPLKNARWSEPPTSTNGVLFKLDPTGNVVYSTYLPLDLFYPRHNVAVDGSGSAYVVGSYPWVEENETYFGSQIGLVKISSDGGQVLLEKHVGGSGADHGVALALDAQGNAYIAGTTERFDDFPVTANAHQPVCGDIFYDPDDYCFEDGVIVVINAGGEVTYASFHGGSFTDEPQTIVTDGKGLVVVAGNTTSGKFPLLNALQTTCPLDDESGDCRSPRGFVSAIRIDGSNQGTLVYSTYLGAQESISWTSVLAATMDADGNAYIGGYTSGKQFPTKDAFQPQLHESFCDVGGSERYCFDGFIVKFSPGGALTWGTYLGAVFDEFLYGLALDQTGMLYAAGLTEAYDFPTTPDGFQASGLAGDDGFLVKIGPDDGGSNPPPDDGGSNPPPDDGGSNPPPDDGDSNPPPDDGGSNPPPDDGGSNPPPDDGGSNRLLLPALMR